MSRSEVTSKWIGTDVKRENNLLLDILFFFRDEVSFNRYGQDKSNKSTKMTTQSNNIETVHHRN